jgi:hypothetical protein
MELFKPFEISIFEFASKFVLRISNFLTTAPPPKILSQAQTLCRRPISTLEELECSFESLQLMAPGGFARHGWAQLGSRGRAGQQRQA